jgi:NAD(P)-dependent dehydrogenase (short-subunit alcohol dehydrogenase family)
VSGRSRKNGKVAVITGAASGIGEAIARRFDEAGFDLVLADIEAEPLERVAGDLRALAVPTDVGSAREVEELAVRTIDRFGRVDILCSNAGVVGGAGEFGDLSDADWRWVFDVNLFGAVHGVQSFLPHLLANPEGGVIVHTASDAGLMVAPFLAHYSASKAAMISFSESVRLELEREGRNDVAICVLLPGPVRTRFGDTGRHRPARFGPHRDVTKDKEVWDAIEPSMITPEEVAEAAWKAVSGRQFWVPLHGRREQEFLRRADEIRTAMLDAS